MTHKEVEGIKYINKYDESNNLIEVKTIPYRIKDNEYEEYNQTGIILNMYDVNNNLVHIFETDYNGYKHERSLEYDKNGRVVLIKIYNNIGEVIHKYKYDENGNKIYENLDNKLEYLYTYDKDNRIYETRDSNNKLINRYIYDNNKASVYGFIDGEDSFQELLNEIEYNENGMKIRDKDYKSRTETIFEYNINGDVIHTYELSTNIHLYIEYDEYNNVVNSYWVKSSN